MRDFNFKFMMSMYNDGYVKYNNYTDVGRTFLKMDVNNVLRTKITNRLDI